MRSFSMALSRVVAGVSAAVLVATLGAVAVAAPAVADSAPVDPSEPATVTADPLPTVQVDGVVWAQTVVGNTVYVAGSFSTARPAGSAPGQNTVPRSNLLAYDLTTGELINSWAPSVNAQARAITASPDGSRIYVGGDFTSVDGASVWRIAALDATTGALIRTFLPKPDAKVRAIVATDTTVYYGGLFSSVSGTSRMRLAASSAADGSLLSWAPTAPGGSGVNAMAMSPDGLQIVVGGSFTSLNGSSDPGYGVGAVTAGSGALLPFAVNSLIRNGGSWAAITSLSGDGEKVYGTGYDYGPGGNFEGTFAASWDGGGMVWIEDCHGDSYSTSPAGGVIYQASHKHDCSTIGGFPESSPSAHYRATAMTTDATLVLGRTANRAYYNFEGNPGPSLLNWFPIMDKGTYTGQNQGPWTVLAVGDYVLYGGEFPTVNGVGQQGLVRFTTADNAPNKVGPALGGSKLALTVTSTSSSQARVRWNSDYDMDSRHLTYVVMRDGVEVGRVSDPASDRTFWQPATPMGFIDHGLSAATQYRYTLKVTDPYGASAWSDSVVVTTPTTDLDPGGYPDAVRDALPAHYWRLGEASGTLARDDVGWDDASIDWLVTKGVEGALVGNPDTAMRTSGSSWGTVVSTNRVAGPQTFTIEAWFNTTTRFGGKIVGFGNSSDPGSSSSDRQIYMDNNGRLNFGVYPGVTRVVTSADSYNDGKWHQAVASLGSDGMHLYVDGAEVASRADTTSAQDYSGYWHIGGDRMGSWPNGPWSDYINASIDEVAIYSSVLTPAQVHEHYGLGTGTANDVLAADAFARDASRGWGSGDAGGSWVVAGAPSYLSVVDGQGRMTLPRAGAGVSVFLSGVSATDVDAVAEVSFDKPATGSGVFASLVGRRVGSAEYRAKVKVVSSGAVYLYASRLVGGSESTLGVVRVPGVSYSVGDVLMVRTQVTGTSPTTVAAKVWVQGESEPADWQVEVTDSTSGLQAAGTVGFVGYLRSDATNAPAAIQFDNLSVTTPTP